MGGISSAKNMVGVSQTVPFPGKKSLDRKAADLAIEQSRRAYQTTEIEVIRDVKVAFCRVLSFHRRVEIVEELTALSQSLVTTADKRVKAGEAPAQELLRAEIEWQRASTEAERFRGELAEARQELAAILGRPDLKHAPLSGELSGQSADMPSSHAHRDALHLHPQMKQAHLAVEEAEATLDRARKEPLPDITLEVAFGSRDSELEGSENLAELSVSLPIPLIDRGQGSRRTSRGNLEAARARLAETEQELFRQHGSALTRLETASKRVDSYRDGILPKTDKALSLMQRGFQEGKFNFIDLLDTQRTVAETRLDYQEALFELNAAEATLDSLLAHEHMN
jgi:cobalt-zinc-cadmium efflux system outer membrane protein